MEVLDIQIDCTKSREPYNGLHGEGQLVSDVRSLHHTEYGVDAEIIASAPGVVNLMGAHTETTDGLVLYVATGQRVAVAVSRRDDSSMRFFASDFGERKRTSSSALRFKKEDRFANLAKGVISRLQTLGATIRGINVTVTSEIPPGIGLASSQAIGVALARAVAALHGFDLEPLEAAQVAHFAEHSFAGIDVGLGGFLSTALSQADTAMFIDSHLIDWEHVPLSLNGCRLVGVNTFAPSPFSLEETIKRYEDCELCLDLLSDNNHSCSLQEVSLDELHSSIGKVPEHARRYCLHIVAENDRVRECVEALRRRDHVRFGKLMLASHGSIRDLYEASSPEVDWVVKHAQSIDGVFGARLAGGTTRSCAVVLATSDAADAIRGQLHEYERIFGFHPSVVPFSPDEGVRIDHREGS
jgi:galactokinase